MKKIVISLGIIVLFSMAIITIISFAQFDNSYKINPNNLVDMTSEQIIYYIQEKQLNQTPIFSYLFPFFSFAGILIGLLVFYIMSLDIEKNEKKDKKIHSSLLRYLPPDERLVMQEILENNGRVNQYEISRLPGMNKVKSHRAIEKLVQRGVVKKESIGKINRIVLVEE